MEQNADSAETEHKEFRRFLYRKRHKSYRKVVEQHAAEKEKGSKGVGGSNPADHGDEEYDELINAAAEVVVETGQASVSMLAHTAAATDSASTANAAIQRSA